MVPSIDDVPGSDLVDGYQVYRSTNGGDYEMIVELPPGSNNHRDDGCHLDTKH